MDTQKKNKPVPDFCLKERNRSYIDVFKQHYDSLKSIGMSWLTISPPPRDLPFKKLYREHKEEFIEPLVNSCSDFMAFCEFSRPNMVMHWHIILHIKDKIKLERFIYKLFVNKIQHSDVLRGEPLHGLPYLVKSYNRTQKRLTEYPVCITRDAILHERKVRLQRSKDESARLKALELTGRPPTPLWMKGGLMDLDTYSE